MLKKVQLIKGLSAVGVISGVGIGAYVAYSQNLFSGLIKTTEDTVDDKDISIKENTPHQDFQSSEILASNIESEEKNINKESTEQTAKEEIISEVKGVDSSSINPEKKDQIVDVFVTEEVTFTSADDKEKVKTYTNADGSLLIKAVEYENGFTWNNESDKFEEKKFLDIVDFYKKENHIQGINETNVSKTQFKNKAETRLTGLSKNAFYSIKIKDSYSLNKTFELISRNSKKAVFEIIKTIS